MEQNNKKLIILFVILIIIGFGVFVLYKKNTLKNVVSNNISNLPVNQSVDLAKKEEFESALKKAVATDRDLDGISDEDEARYKTAVDSSDTDGDGLTDWQEIFLFSTDPLKTDTDNDTFSDGYEVRRGLNPKGPGNL